MLACLPPTVSSFVPVSVLEPRLESGDWVALRRQVVVPLVDSDDEALPKVTFIRRVRGRAWPLRDPRPDLERIRESALHTLRASSLDESVTDGVHRFEGPLACERILDPAFLQQASGGMRSSLMLVAVPVRGVLLVSDAVREPVESMGRMWSMVDRWQQAAGRQVLARTVLLATSKGVTGVAAAPGSARWFHQGMLRGGGVRRP